MSKNSTTEVTENATAEVTETQTAEVVNNDTDRQVLVISEEVASIDLIGQLKNPNANFYCSIKNDGTRATKVNIYNAIQSNDNPLEEQINVPLDIVNVIAHPITVTEEKTGIKKEALRTVLIDKNGICYHAVSEGVTNSLARIFSLFGTPDNDNWVNEPIKLKAKKVQTKNGNNKVTTLELL